MEEPADTEIGEADQPRPHRMAGSARVLRSSCVPFSRPRRQTSTPVGHLVIPHPANLLSAPKLSTLGVSEADVPLACRDLGSLSARFGCGPRCVLHGTLGTK